MSITLEKTTDSYMESLTEFINDGFLDIVEDGGMTAGRFARLVIAIGEKIRLRGQRKVTDFSFQLGGMKYAVHVNNSLKGFVSVSSEEGYTGVSNTEFYPFFQDEDGWLEGYKNLASMINEAWYLCEDNL